MLGKILHFEFPQSYYMGGDANRLNCAMKGSHILSSEGWKRNFFKQALWSYSLCHSSKRCFIFARSKIVYV